MASGPGMPMLAIELSQRAGGVAYLDEGREPVVAPVTGGRREKDELLPAIQQALDTANATARDLASVVVDIGPGGFTGLRISIAAGQMLAEVAGASVVGIPGAEVAAASTPAIFGGSLTGTILVIAATRNGTAWTTRLARQDPNRDWKPVGAAMLLDAPPAERYAAVLADEHLEPTWRGRFESEGIEIVEPVHSATGLAGLFLRGMSDSPPVSWQVSEDPATLRPLYPREPEAVRLWNARRGR